MRLRTTRYGGAFFLPLVTVEDRWILQKDRFSARPLFALWRGRGFTRPCSPVIAFILLGLQSLCGDNPLKF